MEGSLSSVPYNPMNRDNATLRRKMQVSIYSTQRKTAQGATWAVSGMLCRDARSNPYIAIIKPKAKPFLHRAPPERERQPGEHGSTSAA